jgi:hypothetical protein
MRFTKTYQDQFEKLSAQAQDFLMNDFATIRVQDQYNNSKIHFFKRENGELLYLQAIEQEARTIRRDDGTRHTFPAFSTIYTRDERGGEGWQRATDDEGLLDHGHGHWLIWAMSQILEPTDTLDVFRNQANRGAVVLAVDFNTRQSLIEYEMPNGSTSMNVIDWRNDENYYKSISYNSISKKWLRLIQSFGEFWGWEGRQQGRIEPVPMPIITD